MPSAITFHQEPILVEDTLPACGDVLPQFTLVTAQLSDASLDDFADRYKIFNIFPSIDTSTSADSVLALEQLVAPLTDTALIHISADLPFAGSRFFQMHQIKHGVHLSTLRGRDMLKHYGVLMVTSPLAGLPARALIVADPANRVLHVELVSELSQAANYAAAVAALLQAQAR